jgi:hypothetical protein
MPAPANLSAAVRSVIADRMRGHGDDMSVLQWAVLFLDYDAARSLANAIATEPRLARPLAGDDTLLNSALPPEFFVLQDQLAAKARELAQIAEKRPPDGAGLAKAYGELAETCVRCHSAYLGN